MDEKPKHLWHEHEQGVGGLGHGHEHEKPPSPNMVDPAYEAFVRQWCFAQDPVPVVASPPRLGEVSPEGGYSHTQVVGKGSEVGASEKVGKLKAERDVKKDGTSVLG